MIQSVVAWALLILIYVDPYPPVQGPIISLTHKYALINPRWGGGGGGDSIPWSTGDVPLDRVLF